MLRLLDRFFNHNALWYMKVCTAIGALAETCSLIEHHATDSLSDTPTVAVAASYITNVVIGSVVIGVFWGAVLTGIATVYRHLRSRQRSAA